mmetsp:Transcript_13279/g.33152  ORF Transcript_13279/g.33152 Transcript_13279/m.33152 type:complete len:357 (+) Transcript_13279:108-1178(+)
MLGLPHAVLAFGQWWWVPITACALACYYTAELLHQVQSQHQTLTYECTGYACGGQLACRAVAGALGLNQFGIAVLYVITVCHNVQLLRNAAGQGEWQLYVLVATVVLACILRQQAAMCVSVASFVGMASVILVGYVVVDAARHDPAMADTGHCQVTVSAMAAGAGTTLFAYGGHPVYADVQGHMTNPRRFRNVLTLAFLAMWVGFLFVVDSAWTAFRCSAHGYVLDNLAGSSLARAGIVGITVHLLSAIPVVLLPVVGIVEKRLPAIPHLLVRSCMVACITGVAFLIPSFTTVLAVIGACTENLLVIVFPIWMYHSTFGRWRGVKGLFQVGADIVLCVISFTVLSITLGGALLWWL